ncbi:hypothetical protein BGI37_13930 [Snodgrassella alvi]|nr:hypothetical protein BGI37_13930 [Snodgrassella alvi]
MYFHTDLNGCPEELTDENGKILWECSFQLWGKRIHEIEHESIEQNLRYQGQYLDRETGLHYNTFRYYDPDIGRFTQPDPIGLLGGFNLYQYAPNGLTWIDPWGLAGSKLKDGIPENPGLVRRFMSNEEFKRFKDEGFKFNPNDSRGGISATSVKVKPVNRDAIKRSTGALGADYYVDINTESKNVELKGRTKGGVMDWKIKDNISTNEIINKGRVKKC